MSTGIKHQEKGINCRLSWNQGGFKWGIILVYGNEKKKIILKIWKNCRKIIIFYISWLGGSWSSCLTDSLFKTVSWFPLIHWSLMGPICNVYTIVETMVETPAHDKLYLRDTSSTSAVCLMVLLQLSKYFPQLSSCQVVLSKEIRNIWTTHHSQETNYEGAPCLLLPSQHLPLHQMLGS